MKAFIRDTGLGQGEIAEILQTSQPAVNALINGKKPFGKKVAAKWEKEFGIRAAWLITGEGEMLKADSSPVTITENHEYVLLLPISAQGGSLNDFVVSVKDSDCERIVSPIKGADFAINVSGESMYPEYPSGSQILIKKINARAFIDWGKTYVLDTCNGTVIKRIFPSDSGDPNVVKCVSINPDYPPFEVNLTDDTYGIYRVMMLMAVK